AVGARADVVVRVEADAEDRRVVEGDGDAVAVLAAVGAADAAGRALVRLPPFAVAALPAAVVAWTIAVAAEHHGDVADLDFVVRRRFAHKVLATSAVDVD